MTREEWLEERKTCIGASEIGAVMGLSKYATPRTVWEEKIGKAESKPETFAMRRGKFLEPFLLEEGIAWARERGWDIQNVEPNTDLFRHRKVPYFGATPDAFGMYKGVRCTIETKDANDYMAAHYFGEEGSDQIPDVYAAQVTWQMLCSGCHYGFLFVGLSNSGMAGYIIDGSDSEAGHTTRQFAAVMMDEGHRFWRCVEDGIMPPLTGREPDEQWVKQHYSYEDGSITNADEAQALRAYEYLRTRQEREELELLEKALKNQITEDIGEAAIYETPYGNFTRKADKNGLRSFRAPTMKKEVPSGREETVLV